jgi:flagellar motor switch protein FliG
VIIIQSKDLTEIYMGVSDNFIGLIQRTSDSFIRDNIYMIDRALLAKALKNIDPQYQEKVFQNMTDDGAEAVKAMMSGLNDLSTEAIEAAQQEIMTLASQLM